MTKESFISILPEVLFGEINSYLTDKGKEAFSSCAPHSNNFDLNYDRRQMIRVNAARRLYPHFSACGENPIYNDNEDYQYMVAEFARTKEINLEKLRREIFDCIEEYADTLFYKNRFTRFMRYHRKIRPRYRVTEFASSMNLSSHADILDDVLICAIYRCRIRGRIRRCIDQSLTLRALVN